MAGADTSLWPVVVGGLLAGLFALGGIGVGLVGTARRDAAQEHHEKAKRRADKFEELVAAVYEFDHWLDSSRQRAFGADIPETVSPFAKVQSISSVYFPQFDEAIRELDGATTRYRMWIQAAAVRRLDNNITQEVSEGLTEAFTPYAQKRDALLGTLTKFAHDEFQ
jgi:hypothetical protein